MIHQKLSNKHLPRDKSTGGRLRNGENCFDAGNSNTRQFNKEKSTLKEQNMIVSVAIQRELKTISAVLLPWFPESRPEKN